jgi:hypothetical protein
VPIPWCPRSAPCAPCWEKATLLHALHYKGALREGLSRHYYDPVMLDGAGVTADALAQPEMLAAVVRTEMLTFADKVSYDTAAIGRLQLFPAGMTEALASDYRRWRTC